MQSKVKKENIFSLFDIYISLFKQLKRYFSAKYLTIGFLMAFEN